MIKQKTATVRNFIKKCKFQSLRDVIIFAIIILSFHFLYRFWTNQLNFQTFGFRIIPVSFYEFVTNQVFTGTCWILTNIFHVSNTVEGTTLHFANTYIGIGFGCSGVKPILQFIVLMILYPGPWKKKLWYIPVGVLVVHLTNLFRMVSLSLILVKYSNQSYFYFVHDYIFRPFFYMVIFTLWVIWVEYFYRRKQETGEKNIVLYIKHI